MTRGAARRTRLDDLLDAAGVHMHTRGFRDRLDRARRRVGELPDRPVVAWSGGKDSTVCALLVCDQRPGAVLAHLDSGIDLPCSLTWMHALAQSRGWTVETVHRDALAAMVAMGSWDHAAEAHDPREVEGWYDPLDDVARRLDATMVWGLRAAESDRRRAQLASTRGLHTRRDGLTFVAPCWDWLDLDVWAAHLLYGVRPNTVYRRLAELGAPEGAWRVDAAVSGVRGAARGRYVWLRRGWPDVWARMVESLPRLAEMS